MAEIVRRRSWGGVLPLGRHVSISGSSLIQCASVSIALSSFQDGQNAIPVRRFKVEQALAVWMRDVLGVSDHLKGFGQAAGIERRVVTAVGAVGSRAQALTHDHVR